MSYKWVHLKQPQPFSSSMYMYGNVLIGRTGNNINILIYPNLRYSDPPSIELTVHLASLQLLFLNSVAKTAPRCESNFWRQSTPIA